MNEKWINFNELHLLKKGIFAAFVWIDRLDDVRWVVINGNFVEVNSGVEDHFHVAIERCEKLLEVKNEVD